MPAESQNEMMSNEEYLRAQHESDLVRAGDPGYSRSVRLGTSSLKRMSVAPPKPRAVGLSGIDMFGSESFTSTSTRNMSLDLRGEAVSPEKAMRDIAPPTGGGISSMSGRVGERPLSSTMRVSATRSSRSKMFSKTPFGIGSSVNYRGSEALAASRDVSNARKEVNYNPAVNRAQPTYVGRMSSNGGRKLSTGHRQKGKKVASSRRRSGDGQVMRMTKDEATSKMGTMWQHGRGIAADVGAFFKTQRTVLSDFFRQKKKKSEGEDVVA